MSTTTLKKDYKERIAPALMKEFNYTTPMQVTRLLKIVNKEGLGAATADKKIIETAINELTAITGQKAVATLSRKEIIEKSLKDFGAIIVCDSMDKAVDFANRLAPEHLEMCVENPLEYIGRMDNAGSVFLGNYSPEPLGDYFAGPNHVLPTSGTARFFSPLSVDSFIKKSSFIYYTEDALKECKDKVVSLAETEGLTAHANSIKVRFE